MARQNLGRVAMVFKGEYASFVTYNKLDVVIYNGSSYVCNVDSTSGVVPTNTDNWGLLAERGSDGYTPVKGTDYYTASEKAEMEQDVVTLITPTLNQKADKSEIPDVSDFITKDVNNLTYYTLKTSTGSLIDLEINSSTYVVTLSLKDIDGNVISTDSIDLPLESVVVGGSYDSTNQKIVLTLQNGNTVDIPVGALVSGLQAEITSSNKLASDLVDDTNSGNKFVTTSEKQTWNAKGTYSKPLDGIPKTDLTSEAQASLTKADNALPASKMVTLTQAQYDALETKDSDTYYHIPEEE